METHRLFGNGINSLLVLLQKRVWRGKHAFYLWLSKRYGSKVITHRIEGRAFNVPVGEWCFWLEKGPENYYLDEFLPFCNLLTELEKPFTFFDLGADIGTVSSLVATHCNNLKNVIAFEPNTKSFEVLAVNLENIRQSSMCINAAVSDFEGFATFHADSERLNDHEGYIDNSGEGDTKVTSLDIWSAKQTDISIEETIALKIDVEGQEIQAVLGAKSLIKNAKKVIILIEIHPDVLARTNNTPDDLFAITEQIRHVDWIVPLYNNTPINRNLPFFEQMPVGQYDIIGISR
ncbi:FkbM family methyltransferase [Paraglaciecola sp. MB-3u-78]|nr:FkbM family methyltransferase [Paraglaciecola sp. MB-3u-78]